MNPLRADFAELFARHLCRHSQFGINVIHLASLVGIYWALYGCLYALTGSAWLVAAPAVAYAGVLAFNVPARVFLLTAAFLMTFFALLLNAPVLPWWVYPLAVYPFYKAQVWSHRLYDRAFDMTEFDKKYPKGFARFVLLTVYELPIQLNYLAFHPRTEAPPPAGGLAPGAARDPERVA